MTTSLSEQTTLNGKTITFRPAGAEDAQLEYDFIDKLSAESRHYRFLGGVHHLSAQQLKQLCDIDFEHRMAFIATMDIDDRTEQIGVSRYAQDPQGKGHEFTVTVADQWQHLGLGTLLMRKLIAFAGKHKVNRLYSIDLADNKHMHQLADDLGMTAKRDPEDARQIIYSLAL